MLILAFGHLICSRYYRIQYICIYLFMYLLFIYLYNDIQYNIYNIRYRLIDIYKRTRFSGSKYVTEKYILKISQLDSSTKDFQAVRLVFRVTSCGKSIQADNEESAC